MLIDNIHIRKLDLTLLLLFDMLLRLRNMRAVATDIGLSQSAVSHAVARLRIIFEDPLFTREGAGVQPTEKALLLATPISDAIAAVRGAMQVGRRFEPHTSTRAFSISAPDTLTATIAPQLFAALRSLAPHATVVWHNISPERAVKMLADGELDLALGAFNQIPNGLARTLVFSEKMLVVAKSHHPRLQNGLDLQTYCELDHLLVSDHRRARGIVDNILASEKRTRRIIGIMPHMLVALAAASASEAIFTAPASVCWYGKQLFPIALYEPPFTSPQLEVVMLRRHQGAGDPAIEWLADLFQSLVKLPL